MSDRQRFVVLVIGACCLVGFTVMLAARPLCTVYHSAARYARHGAATPHAMTEQPTAITGNAVMHRLAGHVGAR